MSRNSSWGDRFSNAGRGVRIAMFAEPSFYVHLFFTALVVILGLLLKLSVTRWCLLIFAITIVLVAEMLNTAIERTARAITRDDHPELRDSLDIASGAVLLAAAGAVVIGLLVLGPPLLAWLGY